MAISLLAALITSVVVGISLLLEFGCKIFKILFTSPLPNKGAVEIDRNEHIYAHPDYTTKLKDFNSIGVQTIYDVLRRGLQVGADRPHFSFRSSSNEPFQSYTYK